MIFKGCPGVSSKHLSAWSPFLLKEKLMWGFTLNIHKKKTSEYWVLGISQVKAS